MASTNSTGDPIQFDQARDYNYNFVLDQYSGNGIRISREQIEDHELCSDLMRRITHSPTRRHTHTIPTHPHIHQLNTYRVSYTYAPEYSNITFDDIGEIGKKDGWKKGNLKMSVECLLELLGITTDVQVSSLSLDTDNDTVYISLRSKDAIIPVGNDMMIKMADVPEGYEIPNVAIVPRGEEE